MCVRGRTREKVSVLVSGVIENEILGVEVRLETRLRS